MIHSFITHNRTSVCKASRHECNMSAELRKSAGSDIKRLQEMVKRLEEQNAQLKSTDSRRVPSNRINDDNMVKVKLNLDDVPLLDLNAMVEEDEDTWLYVSPSHPPSVEQKRVSPYKYLKDNLDVPELNKVRGSLLAKLESIAAQEEALSRSPPHTSVDSHHNSVQQQPVHDDRQLSDDSDNDDEHVQVKPRRRVPMATANQDDSDLTVRGPVRRRGTPSTGVSQTSRPINNDSDSDVDSPPSRPQRRVPAFHSSSQEDSSLVVKGPLKRRGPSPQPRTSLDGTSLQSDDMGDDDGIVPQRRAQVSQDQEDLVVKGPLRRRGAPAQARQPIAAGPLRRRGESPQPRASLDTASLQIDDNDTGGVVPQRRGQVSQDKEDLVVKGLVRRRGAPPQAKQPMATGAIQTYMQADSDEEYVQPRRRVPATNSHHQDDYNNSWQREDMRPDDDVPIVTAVRRREPNQVRRREPSARSRVAEDVEVRRRSLPQTPTHTRPVPGQVTAIRRPNTPPHSPSPRKPVTPRAGQLAAPRRIPTPRGVSPARSNDGESWSEGFY
ncbi:serine/arginine repetitive matrix protein 1-like [Pocillopora damicornis]|uniref:serine/arginine repetitive matrix protein 1-like n=1 Tax=Pocillopora damicornis TaxID=46731 RepID=UPI000F551FE3|nr:serine/arginine repetitive matrix protein 1-like [Pocillopora damicornis]